MFEFEDGGQNNDVCLGHSGHFLIPAFKHEFSAPEASKRCSELSFCDVLEKFFSDLLHPFVISFPNIGLVEV